MNTSNNKNSLKFIPIILLPLILGGIFYYQSYKTPEIVFEEAVLSESDESTFEELLDPIYGDPRRIIITSIDLRADIIDTGVLENNVLETPTDWNQIGWYTKSAQPSEKKLMILSGHYDDNTGSPAVFYKLKNISVGDTVTVLDAFGKPYEYQVVNSFYVDINDPSRKEVLKNFNEGTSTLVLITCGGIWNGTVGTYDKRLVVQAEYVR